MTITEDSTTTAPTADDVAERIFGSLLGAFEIQAIYLGEKLGWYEALADGPLTSTQLSERTSTSERYAREWLEQSWPWRSVAFPGRTISDASFLALPNSPDLAGG